MASSPQDPQPPLKVDRQWISKLTKGEKALVVAPMVDQSDLPFRLLCRRYGANLAYTPMIHAGLFCRDVKYRRNFFNLTKGTPNEDRPLIAQFCGSHVEWVVQAVQQIAPFVDGVDLNCGCPQNIAKRGNYGAFLLEKEDELLRVVKELVAKVAIPISVKVRLLPDPITKKPDVERSLGLYRKLVDAGIHLLTIHGRTRHQKGQDIHQADWDAIRKAVQAFGARIPIFANGSIGCYQDILDCLEYTGVDGVMSSEKVLEYPPVFTPPPNNQEGVIVSRLQLAKEYLELAKQYPPEQGGQGSGIKCMRVHIFRFLHHDLQLHPELRQRIGMETTLEGLQATLAHLQTLYDQEENKEEEKVSDELSWYMRHRNPQEDMVSSKKHEPNRALPTSKQKEEKAKDDEEEQQSSRIFLFGDNDEGDY